MSSSTTYNPQSTSSSKIPLFDSNKFPMWKTKAMVVLETMDYDMLDIVTLGPHALMFQPTKEGVAEGERKQTPKHDYTAEDKRLIHLDIKARAAIGMHYPMIYIIWFKTMNQPKR
ncbi:hypothetical protein LXL04_008158 [Taraxacum kok-saghyz]